jgi:hypothetical protein
MNFAASRHRCPAFPSKSRAPREQVWPGNSALYPERQREAIERLKVFADGHTLDVPVKQLINEGRR